MQLQAVICTLMYSGIVVNTDLMVGYLNESMVDIIEFWLTHRSNAVIDQINVHRVSKEPFL